MMRDLRTLRVKLRWWFWQRVPHACVESLCIRIGMHRTLCARCGRVMPIRRAKTMSTDTQ